MPGDELFDDLPEMRHDRKLDAGAPRIRVPVRDQSELRAVDIDSLIGHEHPARVIWSYVEQLDLSEIVERIEAREHTPGRSAASPHLLLALWLYACSDGIGSARALARLCESQDAYRWLCGGVSVNYRGLSDFRVAHGDLVERLLADHLASLSMAGVIDLQRVAQDGVRIRASAGASSFHRRKRLDKELRKARRALKHLRQELDDDPAASNKRLHAARERAARDREKRLRTALEAAEALEAVRKKKEKKAQAAEQSTTADGAKPAGKKREPRVSSTDPQARVMKMADGGFRPAYNCQIATVAEGQIMLAPSVECTSSDRGLMRKKLEELEEGYGLRPACYLADSGFHKNDDIQWAWERKTRVYVPAVPNKHGSDPYAPRKRDQPGVLLWRRRMKSPHGKSVYKQRCKTECANARLRQWNLRQFTVRGVAKVTAVLKLYALANNILQGNRLLAQAA